MSRRAVRPVSIPYVRYVDFQEELHFFPLSAYSLTPRATRNTLKVPSLVCNLHAT